MRVTSQHKMGTGWKICEIMRIMCKHNGGPFGESADQSLTGLAQVMGIWQSYEIDNMPLE